MNYSLDYIRAELDQAGVDYAVEHTGKEHLRVRFKSKDGSKVFSQVLANTESDHRAPLNARARVRRFLRDAGYELKPEAKVKVKRTPRSKLIIEQEPEQYYTKDELDAKLNSLAFEIGSNVGELMKRVQALHEELDALASLLVTPKKTPYVPKRKRK